MVCAGESWGFPLSSGCKELLNSKGSLLVALEGDCVQVCEALLSWRDLLVWKNWGSGPREQGLSIHSWGWEQGTAAQPLGLPADSVGFSTTPSAAGLYICPGVSQNDHWGCCFTEFFSCYVQGVCRYLVGIGVFMWNLCIGARGGHGQKKNEVERRGLQLVPSELRPQSWPDPKNTLLFLPIFPTPSGKL